MAFAIPFGSVAGPEQMRRGLRALVSDRVRIPPASFDPTIKNYQWLDLICGLFEAFDSNLDVPLLRGVDGNLTEGPGFNLFVVKDSALATPEDGVLEGITRETVIALCETEGLAVEERKVSVQDLMGADEAFVTSTAGGIMPLCRADDQSIGSGKPGPITARLTDAYWDRHNCPEWSEPVDYSSV